ncbi:CwfJ C-terminus 1-domain-containing protein-like protein [Microdochium trichocladiopsis]|uniref:CwfJ C-terminus 1-domain-containing protein-like protein n=1 Tax=Microdochium trichocladiopsis TaxID=1682393 RepID=A0A9P9BRI5_9PEZI|nr:CwfJ C-terminus 1-domain-containing protein-like protein [Microdochium trichocladiopsis]KAH7027310.1 CwfJ C-terminus 1-domain-containing protein-like protein [Microdochium trichocladiopsis]
MAAKIIVLGSLNGSFETAFKKLAALHAKQDFAFAIITGNLFSLEQDDEALTRLLQGQVTVPLTTYFTVGTSPLPQRVLDRLQGDEDICENLHYLGKRSVTKTSDGIRIVALGGALDTTIVGGQSKEQYMPLHTADDAKALRGANSTDILLTALWPDQVWKNSNAPLSPDHQASVASSAEVAMLCAALKPRYHFATSSSEFFYEREPFFHPPPSTDSDAIAITRFLSLAPYGNTAKAKALYAFNLQVGETATAVPQGSTVSPFMTRSALGKRGAGAADQRADGHGRDGDNRRRRKAPRSPPPGPDRCFFCLSNANLDTHMICSIGEDAYVTTAKGPLPASDTFAEQGIAFPGHQLIIPLSHEPTIRAMAADAEKTYAEMARFKEALQAMVSAQSKHSLGAVTWEISRQGGIHTHWQFLPVPAELLRKGLVEAGFKVEAENRKYPALEDTSLGSGVSETSDFFRVWLWSDDSDTGIQGKELVMRLDDSFRFDLQFARKVMAKLLGLEQRLYWQDVVQSVTEETADVEKFKETFKPWDFTV